MTLADKLSRLVQFRTVSSFDPLQEDDSQFEAFVESLPQLFPHVHAALDVFRIGKRALLYRWEGKDPSRAPVLFCAHFDVVPAGDEGWEYPPFSGALAKGAVWGRGTQDIKGQLACILEAAEELAGQGFVPGRTLYFAFGGDEEVGGTRGAAAIAAWLAERKVHASWLIDEGSPVGKNLVSFVDRPLALIGIAEKGYMDIVIETKGKGGHASMPPAHTALGNLARAIAAIESHPFPARLTRTADSFLGALAPHARFPYRQVFSARSVLAPLLLSAFKAMPSTNAMIRTTCAPTMAQASPKENVLPASAQAVVNVRILPGENSDTVLARIQKLVAPFGASAHPASQEFVVEPSRESSTSSEGWQALVSASAQVFPDAVPAPFLFTAGTDTKHYRNIADDIYRFTPFIQTQEDLAAVHSINEHVRLENLERGQRFFLYLMRGL